MTNSSPTVKRVTIKNIVLYKQIHLFIYSVRPILTGVKNIKPLIKWPGGKSGEISKIEKLIPPFIRYIEPFFGGGALFFFLKPPCAAINDRSAALMEFYRLVKKQDRDFHALLLLYHKGFSGLQMACEENYGEILALYNRSKDPAGELQTLAGKLSRTLDDDFLHALVLNTDEYCAYLCKMAADKFLRTRAYNERKPFSDADLKNNLITGFASGFFMYFRKIMNDLALGRTVSPSPAYKAANFYFIREYCYGAMFRYNASGEFNIPYGGVTYNRKDFLEKINRLFSGGTADVFLNTDISCMDFEAFLNGAGASKDDFIFLDPPYDTDFSDYEGADFTRQDQLRLADWLKQTPAKFMLVIKNTQFIYDQYKDSFFISAFDNQYTYNVRSRNERRAEHLIITNFA